MFVQFLSAPTSWRSPSPTAVTPATSMLRTTFTLVMWTRSRFRSTTSFMFRFMTTFQNVSFNSFFDRTFGPSPVLFVRLIIEVPTLKWTFDLVTRTIHVIEIFNTQFYLSSSSLRVDPLRWLYVIALVCSQIVLWTEYWPPGFWKMCIKLQFPPFGQIFFNDKPTFRSFWDS